MTPLLDIKPIIYGVLSSASMIDFEGYLSKVFFTAGCNFRCGYCHNNEMIHASEGNLSWEDVAHLLKEAKEEWVDAVCISGGEPTMHKELPRVISWFKEQGYKVKLDTNGSLPERLKTVVDLADYVAMDYKSTRETYRLLTGADADTEAITESVNILRDRAAGRYEIRTTVVRAIHDEEEMEAIAQELKGVEKYILQPFVPQESLYDPRFSEIERTDAEYLERIRSIVIKHIPNTIIRGVGQ